MSTISKICLGAIVGVHGIRGEVKVKSFTENEQNLTHYGSLSTESGDRTFELKIVGHSKELLRVKIKGVEDRNTAEKLIGTGLYIERSKLPALAEEEYYHADLIGLMALTSKGEKVGTVNALYNFGAGDLIEIKTSENRLEMLPFNKNFVPTVNLKDGFIIVEMMQYASDTEEESVEG
ncbi:MAG: 16S rRNA processing protein RimM [Alphaproteobacteria bacterium]|nr:16S rRNA processing protein RimM [Alphaproteobacteria bacterium]